MDVGRIVDKYADMAEARFKDRWRHERQMSKLMDDVDELKKENEHLVMRLQLAEKIIRSLNSQCESYPYGGDGIDPRIALMKEWEKFQ